MSTRDARSRLPREPYPGLRPFLDFEAALLFGRERQVKEVIERLAKTQFVAVLGGSGSGKSSLIHAGVVPELRSFGIPGAGDLWLPLTMTPGTNVSAADSAAKKHSPVTRLARRFAALLKPTGSDEADAARQAAIADVFRQEAGFARLIDAYGGELALPPGPDPAEARILFVLDQFEEIFHPTNKGVEDAALLVERVLDHFFNPHPRCHIVLTMRSEHLNDCATFLELPDAINKSSYLIRRLDDAELRDAITGPAQRFLRLHARSAEAEGAASGLPAEVHFEPPVVERLLRDVKAITHDPDHLPLLQHLLARLWEAALERSEMDVPVPTHITEIDLVRAVAGGQAAAPGDEQPLDERTNTLRACVENWPESVYRWHDEAARAKLDELFRHLAFKDPNTGMYSQQRLDVAAGAALLGPGQGVNDLRALLIEGFLGSVDYLFWDDDDLARVTLKVSHESFIRGWSRFRQLIDKESERFDEFTGVLRRCAGWAAGGRTEDLLLEAGEMRLLRESGFAERLKAPGQLDAWFRFLKLDRDGPRLGRVQGELMPYFDASVARLQQRESSSRRKRRLAWLTGLSFLLVPPSFFSVFVQYPVMQRAEMLLEAANLANRAALTPNYPGVGAAGPALEPLLRAAELIDLARTGQGGRRARFSEWLLQNLSWIGPVDRQRDFLSVVAAQAEPPVNGKTRYLLTGALWPAEPRPANVEPLATPEVQVLRCDPQPQAGPDAVALPGRLYVSANPSPRGGPRRALFLPERAPGRDAIALHGATWDEATQQCRYDQVALAVPMFLDPHLVIDADLRYVAFTSVGSSVEVPSVTLHELAWDRLEDRSSRLLQTQQRAVVTHRDAVAAVQRAAGVDRVAVVETWRVEAGRALSVGGQAWRIVTDQAQRLAVPADDPAFEPLLPSAAGSACAAIVADWSPQTGFRTTMFEHGDHCYAITRGNPDGSPPAADDMAAREQALVAVFARPSPEVLAHMADKAPAPVASLSPFAVIGAGDRDWRVGVRGPHAGWLVVRGQDLQGRERLLGAPWSSCALWRLGRQLLGPDVPPPAAGEGAGAQGCRPG